MRENAQATMSKRHAAHAMRFLITGLLLAVTLVLPAVTARTQQSPGVTGYDWTLTGANFAAGGAGVYLSATHEAPQSFTAVAAHWRADVPPDATLRVEVRLSRDDRCWTPWMPIEEPSLENGRWYGENLVLLNDARWMQARLTLAGPVTIYDVTLTAITVSRAPTLAAARAHATQPSVSAATTGVSFPSIINRGAWGADESLMTWPPAYAPARHVVVHHTVTSGGDDPLSEVQAIYYYHAITRGWGDIGYNYLVDRFGNIYEGRAGGTDVIAGHTYGYNTGSLGIGNLGSYGNTADSVEPTAEMLAANAWLSAWVCSHNRFHPLLESQFNDRITFNIAGHRDYQATACPGDYLYAQLPTIRQQAWEIIANPPPEYLADYLNHNTPPVMLAGSTLTVYHTLQNIGTNPWLHAPGDGHLYRLGYHWYDAAGDPYTQPPEEDHRTQLPADVPFGGQVTLPDAQVTAPHEPGTYTLKWDMVHEMVTWFSEQGSPTLDVSITVTQPVTITGRVTDNRDAGLAGAEVEILNGFRIPTGPDGDYTFTQLFPGTFAVRPREPGALNFPNGDAARLTLTGGESATCDFALIPHDNVITNWGFEEGLDGWSVEGVISGTVAHTGDGGATFSGTLDDSLALTQTVVLPPEIISPTLSLVYATPLTHQGDYLDVCIETASGSLIRTRPLPMGGWNHWWLDVDASAGETVTVSLRLRITESAPQATLVHVDEVTLGSGGEAGLRYRYLYLPLVLRGATER